MLAGVGTTESPRDWAKRRRPWGAGFYCVGVIQLANVTAQLGGKTFTHSTCNVWRVRDGKIVEARAHIYDLYAWDEFWTRLSEQDAG
jgi:hypothetical protein